MAILAGSFLLFLVQPMIARLALPRFGGAPNVWNSAMLVYQALLLSGYAYAHAIGRWSVRRQIFAHLTLLAVAAATLPLGLADIPAAGPGNEALSVPLLFAASVGPVFFVIAAQAPLLQRWYAADARAGEPWALYAASNLGSFAGLLVYPLLVEPLLSLHAQRVGWSLGYAVMVALVVGAAWSRLGNRRTEPAQREEDDPPQPVGRRRILLWLALAAVPSGLMLSTTTHLTTDIFPMPLLWVIPLGLYLLSFVIAFSGWTELTWALTVSTPLLMLLVGGTAMMSRGWGGMPLILASVGLLFLVCVALHGRLYRLRPASGQLTLFYLTMSAGGALGGLFTALVAPLVFDWTWEHPLLILAAAALLPLPKRYQWRELGSFSTEAAWAGAGTILIASGLLAWWLSSFAYDESATALRLVLTFAVAACGMLLVAWRPLYVLVLAMLMIAQGGLDTIQTSHDGLRQRSYFGIYTIREYPGVRMLTHGTTLHGEQFYDRAFRLKPTSYYGPQSGAGLVLRDTSPDARVGVVGLGTGTLACYAKPGQAWTFFEIDPTVLGYSRRGQFTYLRDCKPDARIVIGDARLDLAKALPGSLDVLAVDAFSSDAIPLHLLTAEAFDVYLRALAPRGVLLVHISNRFVDLEPVIAAAARTRGLTARVRDDLPVDDLHYSPSSWVLLTRDPATMRDFATFAADASLRPLEHPATRPWTDDYASVLPYIRWHNLIGSPSSDS